MEDRKLDKIECLLQPVCKDEIIKRLSEIPQEIVKGYVEGVADNIESSLFWRSVIEARNNPRTLQFLTENLSQNQLETLDTIVKGLSADDPLSRLSEIRSATFEEPSLDDLNRANKLIMAVVKQCNCTEEFSRHLRVLSEVISLVSLGHGFFKVILERVARMPTKDVEGVLCLLCGEVDLKTNL